MRPEAGPSIALVHEWLALRAGSEKTFEAMARAFPDADLYALTQTPGVPFDFGGRRVTTTFLDRSTALRERRELTLPLMPLAWRTIRAPRDYDVVVSSSHAFARAFPPARRAAHYCYVHAPMRYAWDPQIDARTSSGLPGMRSALGALRRMDLKTSRTVDHFAANSTAVRDRIRRFYGRDARVIHPPVDVAYYTPDPHIERGPRALAVSRFIPYKRLDLAIEACGLAGVPLTIAGSGPDEARLRELAATLGADVRFEIQPSDERLRELYRTSLVLLFPANEDFGIIPVEAQACGTPVIGVDQGGIRDTVVQGETGVRVAEQSAPAVAEALREVAARPRSAEACRRNAERFSVDRFVDELRQWVSAG